MLRRLYISISGQQRQPMELSSLTMSIKCGASDTTSGVASNPVIGYISDKLIDAELEL
ncbi:hypothetical protein MASR2M79_25130 [Aminivibrio sp.]